MTRSRLLEKLDAEVERWNAQHPIGTPVDFGGLGRTTTGTLAFIHEGRPCVRLTAPPVVADLQEVWPC